MREHLLANESLTTVIERMGSGAQDEDWMPLAGREGYVIVTADFDARFHPNVRRGVLDSECAVFTVKSGRAEDVACYVVNAMPTIRRVLRANSLAIIGRIIPGDGAVLLHTVGGADLNQKKTVKRPKSG